MLEPSHLQAEIRRNKLAIFSIASFVIIFLVGIIWATSPAGKQNSHH
jgi:hypothetical protein